MKRHVFCVTSPPHVGPWLKVKAIAHVEVKIFENKHSYTIIGLLQKIIMTDLKIGALELPDRENLTNNYLMLQGYIINLNLYCV